MNELLATQAACRMGRVACDYLWHWVPCCSTNPDIFLDFATSCFAFGSCCVAFHSARSLDWTNQNFYLWRMKMYYALSSLVIEKTECKGKKSRQGGKQ